MYAPFLFDGLLPGNGKTAAGHPFVYQRGNRLLPFD
jgi:hypothetical protein